MTHEPDWDAATENRYSEHRERVAAFRCDPEDDLAYGLSIVLDDLDLADPKHPRHHELLADLWDNREKVDDGR